MATSININGDISQLELTVRAEHILRNSGISTIKQLCELTERELVLFRYMGPKSLKEIKTKLGDWELSLGMTFYSLNTVKALEELRDTNRYLRNLEHLMDMLPSQLHKAIESTAFAESDEANALKAMETIKNYCKGREKCEGCIFSVNFLGRGYFVCSLCDSETPPSDWKVSEVKRG